MNEENGRLIKYQAFPMQMMCTFKSMDEREAVFEAKASLDDYCLQDLARIPLFFFIELLGQAAEMFLQMIDTGEKRYLVGVDEFSITPGLSDECVNGILIKVERLYKFGKISRCRVSMLHNKTECCSGTYTHSGI